MKMSLRARPKAAAKQSVLTSSSIRFPYSEQQIASVAERRSLAMTICFVVSIFFLSMPGFSAEEKTAQELGSGTPLSEEIKGEVKERLDIQKPPPLIELNIKDIVDSGSLRTDEVLQQAKPIPSDSDYEHYALLDSKQVLRPSNPVIPEPPLVTFYPSLSKVATKRWEFRVADEHGEVVKTIKGNGVPPRSVEWDGKNERGQYITVGTHYSYQFLSFDEHGNAQTFPGEPFQLDAFLYRLKGKTIIEFPNDRFYETDETGVNSRFKGLWARALDVVREHSNASLLVEICVDNVRSPLASERRQELVNLISDATNIPASDIRHAVAKKADRGDVTRLILSSK